MKYRHHFMVTLFFALAFLGCNKGDIKLSTNADDVFWVTNKGADMPVWVKGNTLSDAMILVVHGGPGEGAYNFTDYETAALRQQFAMAFWDQRNAGASAGNNNISHLTLPQMTEDLHQVVQVLHFRYPGKSIFLYAHSFGGLLGASYITTPTYQNELKGWIEIDGAHNYPMAISESKKMLIDTGNAQIAKGNNIAKWQEIVEYCKTHSPRRSVEAANQVEVYAHTAEQLMNVTVSVDPVTIFSREDPLSLLANWV